MTDGIKSVTLRNWGPFVSAKADDLGGSLTIKGRNGSGKTSFTEAVRYALTGKGFTDEWLYVDRSVTDGKVSEGSVEIVFHDGCVIAMSRVAKSKSTIWRLVDKDGVEHNFTGVKDPLIKEVIAGISGVSPTLSIQFSQLNEGEILSENSQPRTLLRLLNTMAGAGKVDEAARNAALLDRREKLEIARLTAQKEHGNDIEYAKSEVWDSVTANLDAAQEALDAWQDTADRQTKIILFMDRVANYTVLQKLAASADKVNSAIAVTDMVTKARETLVEKLDSYRELLVEIKTMQENKVAVEKRITKAVSSCKNPLKPCYTCGKACAELT